MIAVSEEQRFRKEERLRRRREYLAVQRRGAKIHLEQLLAFVRPSPEGRRVGITVSKKVGKAVIRNRVKRLLREVWRRSKQLFPKQHDLVIVAKKGAAGATFEELRDQLQQLAKKIERKLRSTSFAMSSRENARER